VSRVMYVMCVFVMCVCMTHRYGFEGEVAAKYSREMMALFTDIFQWLPLAHVIGGKVYVCVWEGLSLSLFPSLSHTHTLSLSVAVFRSCYWRQDVCVCVCGGGVLSLFSL